MKSLKNLVVLLLLFCLASSVVAQNTVGLISYRADLAYEGYNLIYPHNQSSVFLLNNCGEIVHEWPDDIDFRPANTAYLHENGLLYKTKRSSTVTGDAIWAGGGGAIIEIRDWDNNLVWSFEMNNETQRLHHDIAVTSEGNIIAIAWELKTTEECIQAGRDTSTLAQGVMWPDWIFEINPNTDEIVWEWHAWDHLIQDFDANMDNFGVVSEHPELIDVNYGRDDGHPDWMHANSIDYNEPLDQILLSVPYFDEILIIDHSTTTAQAASHVGGFSNRGGDFMFRWGNPRVYDAGDTTNQKLFFQHDAHWVNDHLTPINDHFGDIAIFNNRVGENYSNAVVVKPTWDMYDWSYLMQDETFAPDGFEREIYHPDTTRLFSTGLSSIQFLPNDNALITSGRFGYTFELTPDNDIVWEYITPRIGPNPATQGDSLSINNNLTFRSHRYPPDFEALLGKDLSTKGWIELEPDSSWCDRLVDVMDPMDESNFSVYPNPASDYITIEWDGMMHIAFEVHDLLGRKVTQFVSNGGRVHVEVSSWDEGVYLLSFIANNRRYTKKIIIGQ